MEKEKIIEICQEILVMFENNDINYLDALVITDIIKSSILGALEGENHE